MFALKHTEFKMQSSLQMVGQGQKEYEATLGTSLFYIWNTTACV